MRGLRKRSCDNACILLWTFSSSAGYICFRKSSIRTLDSRLCLYHPLLLRPSLLQHVLDERLARLVATPDQRPARHIQEAQLQSPHPPHLEHRWRHVLLDLHVPLRRPHVLPEGDHVHPDRAQLPERRPYLPFLLAQSQHDARLRHQLRSDALRMLQHRQALSERRPPVPHERRQRFDRLDVVRVYVQAAAGYDGYTLKIPGEVTGKGFDERPPVRLCFDAGDGVGEVVGAAVGEIVPVDTGQHHVAEAPAGQRFGCVFGLVRVERRRGARGLDGAEAAAAGAGVAHEHDGGSRARFVGAAPAAADVRAFGLFADGVQVQAPEVGFNTLVVIVVGDGGLEPFGKAGDGAAAVAGAYFCGSDLVGCVGVCDGGERGSCEVGEGRSGIEAVGEGCGAPSCV